MVVSDLEDDKFFITHGFASLGHMGLKKSLHKCLSERSVLKLFEVVFVQVIFVLWIEHLEHGIHLVCLFRWKPREKKEFENKRMDKLPIFIILRIGLQAKRILQKPADQGIGNADPSCVLWVEKEEKHWLDSIQIANLKSFLKIKIYYINQANIRLDTSKSFSTSTNGITSLQ